MKVAAIAVAGLAALVVVGLLGMFGLALALSGASAADAGGGQPSPSERAVADIPPELLAVYQEAAAKTCNMDWTVLAAIGSIESDHGRSNEPGVHSGANAAGAMGPMQFLADTWAAYGVDADHDGTADVYNATDAIWGAARYLCANGAGDPARLRDAIWNYNHASWYVDKVLGLAASYAAAPAGVFHGEAGALLNNPNLSLSPAARKDLADGVIDQRVIDFLAWASGRHRIAVSVLRTGHPQFVHGTDRVSNHWYGRAADIFAVDGEQVTASSGPPRAFAQETVALGPGRPDEIGLPWADLVGAPGVFSDSDHQDHIHAGWGPNA